MQTPEALARLGKHLRTPGGIRTAVTGLMLLTSIIGTIVTMSLHPWTIGQWGKTLVIMGIIMIALNLPWGPGKNERQDQ